MPPEPEDITIAICTRNNARLLEKTLTTLAQQRVDPAARWSILVVQNKCTDDTQAVVEAFAGRGAPPAIRTVQDTSEGVAFVRERALRESGGALVAFVDDDVLLEPGWVQGAIDFMRAHPEAGAVGARIHVAWEEPPSELALACEPCFAKIDYGDAAVRLPMTGMAHLVTAGLVVRKQAVDESGWLERRMFRGRTSKSAVPGEDTELILRIRRAGYELWYEPAMTQRHMVPARRTGFTQLRRSYYGFGRTAAGLSALALDRSPGLGWRVSFFVRSFLFFLRRTAAHAYHDVLRRRRARTRRAIQIAEAWGTVWGAFCFLPSGLPELPGRMRQLTAAHADAS